MNPQIRGETALMIAALDADSKNAIDYPRDVKSPSVLGDSTFAIPDAATPDTVLTMQYDSKDANTFLKYLMKMILILNY